MAALQPTRGCPVGPDRHVGGILWRLFLVSSFIGRHQLRATAAEPEAPQVAARTAVEPTWLAAAEHTAVGGCPAVGTAGLITVVGT